MYYPGDRIPFLLSLATPDGTEAAVVAVPQISILNCYDDTALDLAGEGVKSAAMTLVEGSDAFYKFLWNTAGVVDGTYVALVSYEANGVQVTSRLLAAVQLGDSRIRAEVAREATTAKASLVALAGTTLKTSEYVRPQDDPFVQDIRTRLQALPERVASEPTLTTLSQALADVRDAVLGSWVHDKAAHTFRLYRLNGTLLHEFTLSSNPSQDTRTRS